MLWAIHNQECIPSIAACRLVNNLFKHCEEKLKSQLHKAKEVGDDNKSDEEDEEPHEDMQESSTTPTSGENPSLHDNNTIEQGTCMEPTKPTLTNQLDGNADSISDPSNEQALPMVNQPHKDANSTNDPLQEQSLLLVKYGVYPLARHEACMISISSYEGLPHENNKLYLSYKILEEMDGHDSMKALDLITYEFYVWLQWDPGDSIHGNDYTKMEQRKPDGDLLLSPTSQCVYVIMMQHGDFNGYGYQRLCMVWDPGVCELLEDKQSLGGEDL